MVFGWMAAALFFIAGNAQAVSLGKIEVASHLGEPFYAEIPLALEANESISKVFVEIAAPTDYRILEVYRDAVLGSVRADVQNDSRGARIELSSRSGLDAPFFNLVLKVRYDRATHFKKYPIFLDLPKSMQPQAKRTPLPTVQALKSPAGVDTSMPQATAQPVAAVSASESPSAASSSENSGFTPYDGWARTGRYGPMVYGDTISTVAERLRVDDTFSRQQVMVALFEKNRARFDQDNINLIKAGTFLDVPAAAEVERITPSQARNVIAEHEKVWKELKSQPRYAAVAEAQKNRYSKRVLVGQQANGVASAPEVSGQITAQSAQADDAAKTAENTGAGNTAASDGMSSAADGQAGNAEAASALAALKQQNEELQARLAENQKQLEEMKNKPAAEAAASARNEKLELKLARLQSELDSVREQAADQPNGGVGWLTWLLAGLIVILLGAVAMLMRREPAHPSSAVTNFDTPASVAAAASASVAAAAPEDDIPEIDVEEADVEAIDGIADLDATTRMTAEQAREFTDSIPDLTDEDTGEMQAFKEEVDDEPDPNVDYLSEADVYMRYGMEDEALQQVNMALRLKPENADAHIKKAEVLKTKSDSNAFEESVAVATQTLTGEDLKRFQEAVGEFASEGGSDDDVSLEDTLPPTNVSELIGKQAARDSSEISTEETISEFDDLGFGDAELDTSGSSETEDTIVNTGAVDEDEAELDAALSELDDLDMGDAEADEVEVASPSDSAESTVDVELPAAHADVNADEGGLDFDLSDIDLPDSGDLKAASDGPQVETADLDKTVAMDWSKDTSIDSDEFDLSGESGAGEGDEELFDSELAEPEMAEPATAEETPEIVIEMPEEAEPLAETTITHGDTIGLDFEESTQVDAVEPEKHEARPAESTPSLDLDAGDLDDGFDVSDAEVEPADDFTSTIRTSLDEVGKHDDFTATGEHDLQFNEDASDSMDESMLEPVSSEPQSEVENDNDEISLDLDEDEEATQKLDSLLSEFTDEDEDKKS